MLTLGLVGLDFLNLYQNTGFICTYSKMWMHIYKVEVEDGEKENFEKIWRSEPKLNNNQASFQHLWDVPLVITDIPVES
jgi:hypothetical protein